MKLIGSYITVKTEEGSQSSPPYNSQFVTVE